MDSLRANATVRPWLVRWSLGERFAHGHGHVRRRRDGAAQNATVIGHVMSVYCIELDPTNTRFVTVRRWPSRAHDGHDVARLT